MTQHRNSSDLIIWGRKDAFNVQKVMWFLDELNCIYQHIPAGGRYGGLDTPKFLAMNPHGKVPVISDKGNIVWESHSILRYLAAQYGKEKFWSPDPAIRAQIEPWMDWQQTVLQPDFLTGVFWGYYRTPEKDRDWPAINASIVQCTKHFKLLDTLLKNKKFLCGSSLSLADIAVGTTLYRYFALDIERPIIPNVEQWYEELKNRSAFQQHVMVSFDHMKA